MNKEMQPEEPEEKLKEMTRNSEVLASFVAYCQKYPSLRFWQALRNWSGYHFILAAECNPATFTDENRRDTFNWEGRRHGENGESPAPAAPEGAARPQGIADADAVLNEALRYLQDGSKVNVSNAFICVNQALGYLRGAVAEVRDLQRELLTEATGHMKTQASLTAANELFMAEQDSRKAVEGEVRELRAKLALAEDYRDGWKRNCEAAVDMLRVLNEETVLTGFPGGDRNQTLANVREMRAQLTKAREALQNFVDSAVTDADMCAICCNDVNRCSPGCAVEIARAALTPEPSETKDGATEGPNKPA